MAGEEIRLLERTVAELRARVVALENVPSKSRAGGVAIVVPGSLTISVGSSAAIDV